MKSIPVSERLIISLYDYSEEWVGPYIKAGYPVMCWDKKIEGDIFEGFSYFLMQIEETGLDVYGFLAAVPCTEMAGSGARWWKEKDADGRTEMGIALAEIALHFVDILKPKGFWTFENPVGRLEKLVPELKPYRHHSFDPCDYGDPYTKKTILWGEFNNNLPKNPVFPLYGSMMWAIPPSEKRQEIRSKTPAGFSKAFFLANQ